MGLAMKNSLSIGIVIFATLTLTACGSSSSSSLSVSGSGINTDSTFPSSLAVASPTDYSGNVASPSAPVRALFSSAAVSTPASAYSDAIDRIDELFAGTVAISDTFTPELFYTQHGNANCYGPKLFYDNHPDGADGPVMGSDLWSALPTGDLGIWQATEGASEACAAAQLNAQMKAVKKRSYIALMSIASMIRAYVDDGNTWPDDINNGDTAIVTSAMNALGLTDISFNSATISLDSAGAQWSYALDFIYTRSGTDYGIKINMTHVPGASENEYEGLLTYMADDTFNPPGNCGSSNITLNGSLHYIRNSATDIRLQSRGVQMCDFGSTALTEAVDSTDITGNVVDPDAAWSDNFNRFTAEFDPSDLGGHYSYVWQAGNGDSHSRILNIGLAAATSGETYFGFGDTVDSSDGSIGGFICNWAGPSNDHTLLDYAQRQHITYNTTLGVFEPSRGAASSSNISYAPTNSCLYEVLGTFQYDRDLDGDLSDETSDTLIVGSSGSGDIIELDLMAPSGGATDIWNYITNNRGFDLPDYPN